MLRRAVLPLLRPGRIRPPVLQAYLQTPSRYYSKGDRPSNSKQDPLRNSSFQQTTPAPKAETSPSSTPSSPPPSHPKISPFGEDPSRDLDDVSESVSRATKRSLHEEEELRGFEKATGTSESKDSNASPETEEPQPPPQPLPDLTRGIPSTLDAELRQARSKQASHSSSLNITEDPAEELPSGAPGREGNDPPREEYVSSSDRKMNNVFRYMYIVLGLGSVGSAIYLGRNWADEEEEKKHSDTPSGWGFTPFYNRVTARLGDMMSYYRDPVTTKLLPDEDPDPNFRFPFVLVISLEDMLVHSEWTREKGWRIAKRPGVDYFLRYLSAYYEIVLFTSQPMAIVEQVLRKLDPFSMIRWPLFREATLYKDGGYVKVSLLGQCEKVDS